MNRDETVDLLSVITAYDNRNAVPATVLAWATASEYARWTFPEALQAVHAHFAESTEFLMPAHITERIKAGRADKASRAILELETVVDAAAAERVQELVAEVAEKLAWDRGTPETRRAMRVRCPHCGSGPGARCVNRQTGRALIETPCHPSRLEAASAEQEAS